MSPTALLLDPALRVTVSGLLILVYGWVCLLVIRREQHRHKSKTVLALASADSPVWLVAYASQTGEAETHALAAGQRLHEAGLSVQVVELNALTSAHLHQAERALFIVSTSGEGDAPDNGAVFAARLMTQALDLTRLHYAVLALGDASYANYCGFGRALEAWLVACQAQAVQARVDVSCADPAALAGWQQFLSHLAGSSDVPDWAAPDFECWRIVERSCLNPGSQGEPLYGLDLVPESGALPDWASGDLVQVFVPTEPDRPREYSIASLPGEGRLRLLVRVQKNSQGIAGLASSLLTLSPPATVIRLRIRPHRLFQLGENLGRPLILIGNGSGLAGLRGHLKARELAAEHTNWLIYGERNAAHDAIWNDELVSWQESGVLQRLDRIYSRDMVQRGYVQDVLVAEAARLREWVEAGAAIYVCGSLTGMAAGVEQALNVALGTAVVQALRASGRYRRDVY